MKVFINPGHAMGGNPDPGCINKAMNIRECDLALCYGYLVSEYLKKAGCEVELLQSHNLNGEEPDYPCVVKNANDWGADIFVSIHVNAGGGHGAETYCYDWGGEGERLAHCIQKQLCSTMQKFDWSFRDRGVKVRDDLCVLRATNMPAVLVETGFIDHASDSYLLKTKDEEVARAIARGVTDYEITSF